MLPWSHGSILPRSWSSESLRMYSARFWSTGIDETIPSARTSPINVIPRQNVIFSGVTTSVVHRTNMWPMQTLFRTELCSAEAGLHNDVSQVPEVHDKSTRYEVRNKRLPWGGSESKRTRQWYKSIASPISPQTRYGRSTGNRKTVNFSDW